MSGGDGDGEERRSFNQRLRDRYFGRPRPDAGGSGAGAGAGASADPQPDSVLTKSNQMGFFGRVQRPGGFDTPPKEPIEFEGPLPWELGGDRDPDADGQGSKV
ncbi:hypothetical protein [Herbiconiux sp.]|uniref:hypothetical protein n=1 Tax=Herbiconiux sp. TaxID=1871186 RepID=UPI0025C459C8|nr:hypothetical protein [Herbiconiux sp.]